MKAKEDLLEKIADLQDEQLILKSRIEDQKRQNAILSEGNHNMLLELADLRHKNSILLGQTNALRDIRKDLTQLYTEPCKATITQPNCAPQNHGNNPDTLKRAQHGGVTKPYKVAIFTGAACYGQGKTASMVEYLVERLGKTGCEVHLHINPEKNEVCGSNILSTLSDLWE